MNSDQDRRWIQRLQNFNKAFALLERSVAIVKPSEIERAGIIQSYEVTFELSWKLMKDYLDAQGLIAKSPRDAIKLAFQTELVEDGHNWIKALEDRNLTSHTYDEETAEHVLASVRTVYFPLLQAFARRMNDEAEQ